MNLKLRGANLESPSSRDAPPNPIYKLSAFQMGTAHPFQVVLESDIILGDGTPIWKQTSISMEELCSGDKDFPIMISVFDCAATELLIGSCETTVSDLLRNKVGDADDVDVSKVFPIKNDQHKESGLLVVVEATITDKPQTQEESLETTTTTTADLLSSQLETLRKALDAVLLRTEALESETSELRHDNKRLLKKVAYLEDRFQENQTKTDRATKEIASLKRHVNNNHSSNNNHEPMELTNLLDESLSNSSIASEGAPDHPSKSKQRRERTKDLDKSRDMDKSANSMDKSANGRSSSNLHRSSRKLDESRKHHHHGGGDQHRPRPSSKDHSRRRERSTKSEDDIGHKHHHSHDSSPHSHHTKDNHSPQKDRSKNSSTRDSSKERSPKESDGHSAHTERSKPRDASPPPTDDANNKEGTLKGDGHSARRDRSRTRDASPPTDRRSVHRDRSKPRSASPLQGSPLKF